MLRLQSRLPSTFLQLFTQFTNFCGYVRNTWQYSNIMSFIVDEDIKCFEKTQVITAVSF